MATMLATPAAGGPAARSEYSLHTVDIPTPNGSIQDMTDRSHLLSPVSSGASQTSYGSAPPQPPSIRPAARRRILFIAGARMAGVFLLSCLVLGGTLWLALPTLDPEDRKNLRVPKSFAQLQALNLLLKKYRDVYPFRIVVCFTTVYLFLQAFSLPGSMYLSIVGGAVWGMPIALPLACTCVATGATLCYLISAALGPALHTLPSWRARFDTWSAKIAAQRENLIPFLILLRLAPLPPHWVVNVLCPHVGIGIVPFWCTTWLGILGVTVIHTRLGQTLDEMTSAEDFHLISWKNFFGLAAIVVGVLIPVAFRFYFKKANEGVVSAADVTGEAEEHLLADDEESQLSAGDRVLAAGPSRADGQKRKSVTFAPYSDGEDEYSEADEPEDEDDDDDLVLEVGPDVRPKGKARDDSGPSSSSAPVRG